MNENNLSDNQSNFIPYTRKDGKVNVDVFSRQIIIKNLENFNGVIN